MNVWLITIGEPVPVQQGTADRLHRTGYLAHFLARQGHSVTWWTSTFDHFRKKHWFDSDAEIAASDNLRIRLIHGRGYRSNLSVARIRDHREVAARFAVMARKESRQPDVIVAALPTIELCQKAVEYGRARGVPVVLDMRDMWPDIFVEAAPGPARFAARLLLWPMFRAARQACAGATAIIGITEAFVDWGLNRGGRTRTPLDRAFPMGYTAVAPSEEKLHAAEAYWDQFGVTAGGPPVVCFVGTIGRQFDLDTVCAAARKLRDGRSPVRLLLCGTGDYLEHYKKLAADLPNVIFPGWVDAAAIHVLMRRSAVGLDPLPDRFDFLATINNKAIEYMSAGLPIVSTPRRGVLADLLAEKQCGMSYDVGDPEGLVAILSRLCSEPSLRDRLAANARRVFEEDFVAEKVYARLLEHLEVVAATRTAGPESHIRC